MSEQLIAEPVLNTTTDLEIDLEINLENLSFNDTIARFEAILERTDSLIDEIQTTIDILDSVELELNTATDLGAGTSEDIFTSPDTDLNAADDFMTHTQGVINSINRDQRIRRELASRFGRYAWVDRLIDRMQLSNRDYIELKNYVLLTGVNNIAALLCSDTMLTVTIIILLTITKVVADRTPGAEYSP